MDQDNIKSKLETDKNQLVSADELKKNISKFDVLDDTINGKFQIPNADVESLQELRTALIDIHRNPNIIQEGSQPQLNEHSNEPENNEQKLQKNSNKIVELNPQKQKVVESIGSKFHEERRKGILKSDGTYEPNVEKVTDEDWIAQHNGQTEVDLANTSFEDLPNEWKREKLEAAKVVLELVYEKLENGEEITPDMIEKIAEIVHNKWLERNGEEGLFEGQRVPYNELSDEEKAKDRNQVLWAIEVVNSDYFNGKSHKIFEGNTADVESNSKFSDRILNEINEENKSEKLDELKKQIIEQYKQSTGEELELTDEQLLSILDAHEQDGILGELTLGQLKQKVEILSETITDKNVRRFLLEAGFCGSLEENHQNINIGNKNCEIIFIGNYGELKIKNIDGTITNINFQIEGRETKYLEFFITEGKIEDYKIIEQLYQISEEMGAGGKIGFGDRNSLIGKLEKQVFEKIINSENFSIDSILNKDHIKYSKNYTYEVFRNLLSFGINLPKKIFSKNLLTTFINTNRLFEARAKVNYLGNEQNKIYFHEMIGEYIDGINLESCNPEELSDLIIDYHFNKISYNVFLDIKELLRFQIEKGDFLPLEHLKIYRDILNIDKLSNKEKIELFKFLKGKNIEEMFDNDLQRAKETTKKKIADSVLSHETIEEYKDENLSKRYGVDVYHFNGQPFYALVKIGNVNRKNPEYAVTRSFSLVGTEYIGIWGDNPGTRTFIYEGLSPNQIIHISNEDSGSGAGKVTEYGQQTERVYFLGGPSELLSNTEGGYNELVILEKGTGNTVENYQLNDIKPIAIYCYEITEDIIKTAKEYGVGVALINKQKYGEKNTPNKGHNHIFEEYMYPGDDNKSEDFYYIKEDRRSELCTFENMDKIDNMIENNQ